MGLLIHYAITFYSLFVYVGVGDSQSNDISIHIKGPLQVLELGFDPGAYGLWKNGDAQRTLLCSFCLGDIIGQYYVE